MISMFPGLFIHFTWKIFHLNIEVTGRKQNSPLPILISFTELFKQKVIPVFAGLGNCWALLQTKNLWTTSNSKKNTIILPKPGYLDGSGILVEDVGWHACSNNMRKKPISTTRKGESSVFRLIIPVLRLYWSCLLEIGNMKIPSIWREEPQFPREIAKSVLPAYEKQSTKLSLELFAALPVLDSFLLTLNLHSPSLIRP